MFHMYYGFPGRPVLPGMQIQHILISWWGRKVLEPPSDHPAQLIRFTEFSMVYLVLSPSSLLPQTENISIKMRIVSSVEDLCAHDIFRVWAQYSPESLDPVATTVVPWLLRKGNYCTRGQLCLNRGVQFEVWTAFVLGCFLGLQLYKWFAGF